MLSAFTSVLHVPYLSKAEHLIAVLDCLEIFNSEELKKIAKNIHGRR